MKQGLKHHAAFVAGLLLIVSVLGGSSVLALSQLSPPDFAPFTATQQVWLANLTSFGEGTITYEIEYRSRNDWKVTEVSHSFDPRYNGTSWSYQAPTATFFDSLRAFVRHEQAPEGRLPDRWLRPGLVRSLSNGSVGWTTPAPGRLSHVQPGRAAGERTEAIDLSFEILTGRPLLVETRADGRLVERITYTYR